MSSLVVYGAGDAGEARRRSAEGGTILAFSAAAGAALSAAGVPHLTLAGLIGPDEHDRIDAAAIDWTKAWGTRPMVDGRSFRDLYHWKGVSLWWFAELYLHHSTPSTRYVRLIETFDRLLELVKPEEVEAAGLRPEERLLLARTCVARGILFHGRERDRASEAAAWWAERRRSLEGRWNTVKALASAFKASLSGPPPGLPGGEGRRVLFLSHAAFWRRRRDPDTEAEREYEHYFDRLIPEAARDPGLRPVVVAVGPRAAFRRRGMKDRVADWMRLPGADGAPYVHVNRFSGFRVFREVWRGTAAARRAWRTLRRSPAVHQAFSHRGVSFSVLAAPDLAGTLLLQVPWAVRSYEEMAAAVDALKPDVVCLYAESSGWGRAAVAACRARGVPTVGVQHGILYPKYYSYLHRPDEAACPRPDRTAVFGEAAKRFLVEDGGYSPESLVVTGSPKFDDLLRASRSWDRSSSRHRYGVGAGERLLVVASRYQGIRETHQSIGSAFPALIAAVEALPGLRCLVKPHPAEPAEAYLPDLRAAGATRVAVAPAGADLMELLHAADALVTVESLSAVEALVLGRPVLVLNMPTNLRAMVDQGVALGVKAGEDPLPALRELLFDSPTRELLALARQHYLSDVAAGVDGQATARILRLVKEVAAGTEAGEEPGDGQAAGHGRV